jgi:hypothetical protein
MSALQERWYWCEVVDDADRPEEPDWSRVPEERREIVRERWGQQTTPEPVRWKMWGPQIAGYRRQPGYHVTVVGPAE